MNPTTVYLAVDPRMAAFAFLGVLGFIAVVFIGFVIKSSVDQRKYSKAELPSLPTGDEAADSMVREPTESAFSLADLDDELPDLSGEDENGTTLDQLPGVELNRSFAPEPEEYEPEADALPSLAMPALAAVPAMASAEGAEERPKRFKLRNPRQDNLDAAAAQELEDDEEDQDFTPVVSSNEDDAFEEPAEIDKMEEQEESLVEDSSSADSVESPVEEVEEPSLFRNRKPISIPTLTEESEASEGAPYVGKRRLETPADSDENAMKEES